MLQVRLQIRAKLRHFSGSFSSCANSVAQSRIQHSLLLSSLPRRFLLLVAVAFFMPFLISSGFLFLCCFGIPPHSHHIHIRTEVYHIVFLVMFCLTLFFSFCLMRVYSMERDYREWGITKVSL